MKKTVSYYMSLDYTIRLKENGDGTFFAEIEELPGCFTEGATKEETLTMIEDAKKSWIEVALQRKISIPEPVADTFSGKLNIRMPKSLHRHLVYRAKQEGVSLNTLITTSLSAFAK